MASECDISGSEKWSPSVEMSGNEDVFPKIEWHCMANMLNDQVNVIIIRECLMNNSSRIVARDNSSITIRFIKSWSTFALNETTWCHFLALFCVFLHSSVASQQLGISSRLFYYIFKHYSRKMNEKKKIERNLIE